jgi:hypothetical protein
MIVRRDPTRSRLQIAITFIDNNEVDEFDNTALDTLQFVTATRSDQQEKDINHVCDGSLGLTDSNGFHDDDIKSCSFAKQNCLAGAPRDAPKRSASRRGAHKGARMPT